MESCVTLTDQWCVIHLTAWISIAWSSSWAGKKYVKKTWEQSPVSRGIITGESFSVWKWQQPWLFAASLWKILWLLQGMQRPLCPGEFQLHWLFSQSFFSWFALIKSLEDVLVSGGGDFYMGDWTELLECIARYSPDGFQPLWFVFDSDEDRKVMYSSSLAYVSQPVLGSTGCAGSKDPCRMPCSCCAPQLGHCLCSTNMLEVVPLAAVVAAVLACTMQYLVRASLGTLSSSPLWNQHSCLQPL